MRTITQLRRHQADHVARSLPKGAVAIGKTDTGDAVYDIPTSDGGRSRRILLNRQLYNREVRKLARAYPRQWVKVQATSTYAETWGCLAS